MKATFPNPPVFSRFIARTAGALGCITLLANAAEAPQKPFDWNSAVKTIATLTPEQAAEWAALKNPPMESTIDGGWAALDSLTTLTPEVAELIVKPERALSLNGLTELPPALASVLAKHAPGKIFGLGDLRLNGIKSLSPPAAEALASHKGKVLLYGLETLDSVPLARKLAGQWGELRLGIKTLSPKIASELAKHRGTEEDRTRPGVVFRRQDGAASILRLDELEALTPETAESLAAHEGVLVLNGLTSLPPDVAAALAKRTGNSKTNRTGTLVLNGLSSLSAQSASAIAAFPGELVLKAISVITPETAAALARHKGRLHLTGLTELSASSEEALKSHPNLLLPRPLPLPTNR
jgi:hypothetical protein